MCSERFRTSGPIILDTTKLNGSLAKAKMDVVRKSKAKYKRSTVPLPIRQALVYLGWGRASQGQIRSKDEKQCTDTSRIEQGHIYIRELCWPQISKIPVVSERTFRALLPHAKDI